MYLSYSCDGFGDNGLSALAECIVRFEVLLEITLSFREFALFNYQS